MNKEIQKACLLSMDRTGSNMLSDRLNSHPEICFYNELFHRQYAIFDDTRVNSDDDLLASRDKHPSSFISRAWAGEFEPEECREGLKMIGFKLFLNHNGEALAHVIRSDAKIVFLRRRNALARFTSFKIASKTNQWKSKIGLSNRATFKFIAPEFRAYMQNFLALEALTEMTLTRWNRSYVNIWYEDIVKIPQVWEDLTKHLGFNADDFKEASLVKQNSSDILSRVSNPEDLKRFVSQIDRYDWLAD